LLAVVCVFRAATRIGVGWLATPTRLPSLYRAAHVLVAVSFGAWALTAPARTSTLAMPLIVATLFGAGNGAWLSLGRAVLAARCGA